MWDLDLFMFARGETNDLSNSNLSLFHYTLLTVTFIGILLAVFSEDSAADSKKFSWIAYEFLPMPATESCDPLKDHLINTKRGAPSFARVLSAAYFEFIDAVSQGEIMRLCQRWHQNIQSYYEATTIRNLAQSRRHLIYLFQKKNLNLTIEKNESEFQSYVDMKHSMMKSQIWPFFWNVDDVKNKQIICQGKQAIPFSSYSYLDFIRNSEVQEAAIEGARAFATGNHGPRMLGGGSIILRKLEKATGNFFGREDSLVFSAGYLACMSLPAAVCKEGDLIVYDSRSHASLQSGLRLCDATCMQFSHNNFEICEQILKKHRHKYKYCWILIESVYSMDGDIGDLPAAYKIAKKYSANIICDEAHGLGVIGKTGRGIEEYFNLPGACSIIVGTYSKSISGVGGYIVANQDIVSYLDFHTQGNLFSAPLTAYSASGAIKAFELIDREPWRIQKLHQNKIYFRSILKESEKKWPRSFPEDLKFIVAGHPDTSVIPIIYPNDADRALRVASALLKEGYMVSAVVYPACPAHSPRLRITVTACYEYSDIEKFVDALIKVTVYIIPRNSKFDLRQN